MLEARNVKRQRQAGPPTTNVPDASHPPCLCWDSSLPTWIFSASCRAPLVSPHGNAC
jgi:hypothetical protein